jgi:hypothetical protein
MQVLVLAQAEDSFPPKLFLARETILKLAEVKDYWRGISKLLHSCFPSLLSIADVQTIIKAHQDKFKITSLKWSVTKEQELVIQPQAIQPTFLPGFQFLQQALPNLSQSTVPSLLPSTSQSELSSQFQRFTT